MVDHVKRAILLVMVTMVAVDAQLPTPSGINFIGIGYDIIDGNPEGSYGIGGVDPGLLVTRRIFKMTHDLSKTSSDNMYSVPDEVKFIHRSSAVTSSTHTTFYGESSYASKLSAQVDVAGSYENAFASVAFSASARYEQITNRMSTEQSVFYGTQTITNNGNARYQTELASPDAYALENGFVADACNLPRSYDYNTYMSFLDSWGTHVVIEVDLGVRSGTNYEESRSTFVEYASKHVGASLSASGSYKGFSASLTVDMETFNSGMQSGDTFGSTFTSYTVGSTTMNEPIKLTLLGMHEVFDDKYWTLLSTYISTGHCNSAFHATSVRVNLVEAMKNYADYKSVLARTPDDAVKIPLVWPDGTYGLPKPVTGCPLGWHDGYRYHDTEDDDSNNYWSSPLHLYGWRRSNNMRNYFCMKTTSADPSGLGWAWPAGSYCIYKRGSCPRGFTEGSIYWDDEDDDNENSVSGVRPDGDYNSNTRIYFCCRSDGYTHHPIFLPTDNNFMLFPLYSSCQLVNGMSVSNEYFHWDNEDGNNQDSQTGMHPYEGVYGGNHNIKLHFCYYSN
ncbi:uncharacterized protein LOC121405848 [Lytechinus variegatus]|uniref:uncharacterized protein LOC121405848 n=1 Tax=Lytechinus variegatus TaxID=7654 RepID=UPI001BB191F7|nr:uncharacterized protein LOC121405848 [Lytechinus variegatus]XP_041452751.1 uncharacterized protein LOC121405848 [Lytechinus variegatus]